MNTLRSKVKKVVLDSFQCVIRAYILQREKELKSSREKWKKKAFDRQATIQALERELRETKNELKKIDFISSR